VSWGRRLPRAGCLGHSTYDYQSAHDYQMAFRPISSLGPPEPHSFYLLSEVAEMIRCHGVGGCRGLDAQAVQLMIIRWPPVQYCLV
jgi:hypothetical protein